MNIGSIIGVSDFPVTHVGVYIGNGQVFHNHSNSGMKIVPLSAFSRGRTISIVSEQPVSAGLLRERIQRLMSTNRIYNWLTFNCEHAAFWVCRGVASSPQIRAGSLALLTIVGLIHIKFSNRR